MSASIVPESEVRFSEESSLSQLFTAFVKVATPVVTEPSCPSKADASSVKLEAWASDRGSRVAVSGLLRIRINTRTRGPAFYDSRLRIQLKSKVMGKCNGTLSRTGIYCTHQVSPNQQLHK